MTVKENNQNNRSEMKYVKAELKRYVLRFHLKVAIDSQALRSFGRLFQR